MAHPLAAILEAVAAGDGPEPDGACDTLPPDADGTTAVVALTGHAYVLCGLEADEVASAVARVDDPGGFGAAHDPRFVSWLAERTAASWIGTLDAVLVADLDGRRGVGRGVGASDLAELDDADERWGHPRLRRARDHRRSVRAFAGSAGLVTVGHGLVDRIELSVERTDGDDLGPGQGRALIAAGLDAVAVAGPARWCWAQVAPGNARSLRAFLAAGFRPVGSEQLLGPSTRHD